MELSAICAGLQVCPGVTFIKLVLDSFLLVLCRKALAGVVILLHACLDIKAIILGKYHYVLYFLVLAIQVNFYMVVDKISLLCSNSLSGRFAVYSPFGCLM